MENEFMKRGYLLPKGCKDLIDVLKPRVVSAQPATVNSLKLPPIPAPGTEIVLPERMTVAGLAVLLGRQPFMVIAELMRIGVFATAEQEIDFDDMEKVLRQYRLIARRTA